MTTVTPCRLGRCHLGRSSSKAIALPFAMALGVALGTASPLALADATTGPKVLNDTGATQCYVNKVLTSDCASTGQDADFGRDVKKPDDSDGHAGFSFRKVCNTGEFSGTGNCPADPPLGTGPNDWGCTHDKVTKLTWEVKTNDGGLRDSKLTYTNFNLGPTAIGDISEYQAKVNSQGLCGFNDWRIPNVVELQSIFDYSPDQTAPAIDKNWLPNSNGKYWASNYFHPSVYLAWFIEDGTIMATYSTAQYRAILVRQGVKWLNSKDRYIKNGNQVQDLAAGLTWRNCNEPCATGNTQGEYYSPAKAFKQAQKVAKETGEKWRVPSIKEILSIQTFGDNPLLDVNVFNIGGKMQNGDFTYITNTPSFDNSNVKYYASDILIDDNKGKTAYPIHAGKYKLTLVK